MSTALTPVLTGFAVSIGLIAAIGAQNLFVLKAAIAGRHAAVVAFICSACDAVLMALGVLGLATLIGTSPIATQALGVVGCLFLLAYGVKSLRSAIKGGGSLEATDAPGAEAATLASTVGLTLALTLLNPHVYLDTVVLVGSIGTTFAPEQRPYFLLGAASASLTWFFGIALGGRVLRPLFKKALAWQLLDGFSALVMFWVAYQLARFVLKNAA
jgi:L-lysine exporter family protein LysE/ArgO